MKDDSKKDNFDLEKIKIEDFISSESLSSFESDYNDLFSGDNESHESKIKELKVKKLTQDIENNKEDYGLKKKIAYFLMWLLSIQSIIIFGLIFLQGFKWKCFYLNDYIFYILISGTLIESYFLVRIVVQHLFPNSVSENNKNKKK